MNMKSKAPSAELLAARADILKALEPHKEKINAMEILALMAHITGQVIAFQDQHKVTREMALEVVAKNIEEGNAEAITAMHNTKGNA